MSNALETTKLSKRYGRHWALQDCSVTLPAGRVAALVGPNGAGKTTLFSLILKEREADAGTIERDEWTMVGHLPQEGEALGDETVLDVATGRVEELPQLEKRLHELEKLGEVHTPEYMEIHAKHDKLIDPEVEMKAKKMLRGLGYKEADFDRPALWYGFVDAAASAPRLTDAQAQVALAIADKTLARERSRLKCRRLILTHMNENLLQRPVDIDAEAAEDGRVVLLSRPAC